MAISANLSTSTNRYIFSDILKKGSNRGFAAGKTDAAIKWYRTAAKSFTSVSRDRLLREKSQIRTSVEPGSMYMFAYDAKHKDTLESLRKGVIDDTVKAVLNAACAEISKSYTA